MARTFLGSDQSYRQAVRRHGQFLTYADERPHSLAARGAALSHTTVWRWLSWLGDGLPRTFQAARRLLGEKDHSSTLHRETWQVSPAKYRSESRQRTLQQALQALVIVRLFPQFFGKAIFPTFATGRGWT